jgi:hypothetical protein
LSSWLFLTLYTIMHGPMSDQEHLVVRPKPNDDRSDGWLD